MSWFNLFGSTTTTVATLQRRLRDAERRLLDVYAPRFAATGDNNNSTTTTWQAVDTPIASSVVPLGAVERHFRLIMGNHDNKTADYTMHSIRVTSDTDNNKQSSSTSAQAPLVLLHGYMNGGAYFYRNLNTLSRYFSTVHAVDLLGWGLSSRPRWPRHAKMSPRAAEDVFVESLEAWRAAHPNLDRMVLTGHSMGGYLAVAYAERYPHRVERLILLSPAGVPAETAQRRAQQEQMMQSASWRFRMLIYTWRTLFACNMTPGHVLRALPTQRAQRMVHGYLQARIPALADADERQAVADYLHLNSILPGSGEYWVTACLRANLMAKQPLLPRIAQLGGVKSITFLYGAHDWMDPSGGLAVQEACTNNNNKEACAVTVQVVDNAGHLLLLENPEPVNAGIIAAAGGHAFVRQYLSPLAAQSIRTLERQPMVQGEEEDDETMASLATQSASS